MASESNSNMTAMYDIILNSASIIEKCGGEIGRRSWDKILDNVERITVYCEKNNVNSPCIDLTQDILTKIEELMHRGQYTGSIEKVFSLIERCSYNRPEKSVFNLMHYLFNSIQLGSEWLDKLNMLLTRYYINDIRSNIRIRALQLFTDVFYRHQMDYEKELIEDTVARYLGDIAFEDDTAVQMHAIQLLVDLSMQCSLQYVGIIIDILQKVLDKPFQSSYKTFQSSDKTFQSSDKHFHSTDTTMHADSQHAAIKLSIEGLINIFAITLCKTPSCNAIKALSAVVTYLLNHYKRPELFDSNISIRITILDFLLNLQMDSSYHLGYSKHPTLGLIYSPYLLIESDSSITPKNPLSPIHKKCDFRYATTTLIEDQNYPLSISYLSASYVCDALKIALLKELDWRVLFVFLQKIQEVLKNKVLLHMDIEPLVTIMCNMVSDKSLNLPEALRNTPIKFTSSDFLENIFPILSVLVSYTSYLEPNLQLRLIKCLELGLVSRNAPRCVNALTICILEMSDTMVKLLPEVLLNLSKISATIHIAIPVLEFLSMLTNFPHVFINFVPDQYMSVFAISLPYTNPMRYNLYIVSLAHHVISVWFLKCRITLRRDFVKYIMKGLKSNTVVPFAEGYQRASIDLQSTKPSDMVNEDSSNRKRCSSFVEQGCKQKEKPSNDQKSQFSIFRGVGQKPSPVYDSMMLFHRELTETCIDLMSRYTFSGCDALPTKHSSSDFILQDGHSMTWLLGSKLITITTSGCTQKPIRGDLCDRCYRTCMLDVKGITEVGKDLEKNNFEDDPNIKRRSYTYSSIDDVKRRPFLKSFEQASGQGFSNSQSDLFQDLVCSCWCQGWTEIRVRRPTGDTSWIMRLENEPTNVTNLDYLLFDMSTLNLASVINKGDEIHSATLATEIDQKSVTSSYHIPTLNNSDINSSVDPSSNCDSGLYNQRQFSEGQHLSLQNDDDQNIIMEKNGILDGEDDYTRNPVCRSNSSPEMNSNLKTQFLNRAVTQDTVADSLNIEQSCTNNNSLEKKCVKNFTVRGNCEAIPEECTSHHNHHEKPNLEIQVPSSITKDHYAFEHKSLPTSPTKNMEYFPNGKSDRSFNVYHQIRGLKKSLSSSHGAVASAANLMSKPPIAHPPKLSPWTKQPGKDSTVDPLDPLTLDYKRHRLHTVSVMSSVKHSQLSSDASKSSRSKECSKSGVNPSFVFLQLYHSAQFGVSYEKPLLLPQTPAIQRAVVNFDRIPPYETHKVGVIYVGPGQANNEAEILRNYIGTIRYVCFLQKLGILLRLSNVDPQNLFLGGLDRSGTDGEFAYIWKDEFMQVIFHVATLMPNEENDPNCNNKKRHIGNDYVVIVYNESGISYEPRTIKSQLNFASVIIEPLDNNSNQVTVKVREDLTELVGNIEPKIVSDENVSLLCRQLALHLNLASKVLYSRSNSQHGEIYASNWLERFRKIKQIRSKILEDIGGENSTSGTSVTGNNSSGSCSNISTSANKSSESSSNSSNKHNIFRKMHVCDFTEYT